MPPRPATPSIRQPAISLPGGNSSVGCVSVIGGRRRIIMATPDRTERMSELDRAVETVIRRCLGVREGERVLVVADAGTRRIGDALRDGAAAAGGEAVLAVMDPREVDGQEPPEAVAAALAASEVFIAPTSKSLSHTR